MTWASIKIFFEKLYVWCVQHWRWLVFGTIALVAYLTGRKNARALWAQAELAKDQYKRESEKIEKAHAKKDKKIKRAEIEAQKLSAQADEKKERAEKELESQKRNEEIKLSRDSDAIDAALKDAGIDEV